MPPSVWGWDTERQIWQGMPSLGVLWNVGLLLCHIQPFIHFLSKLQGEKLGAKFERHWRTCAKIGLAIMKDVWRVVKVILTISNNHLIILVWYTMFSPNHYWHSGLYKELNMDNSVQFIIRRILFKCDSNYWWPSKGNLHAISDVIAVRNDINSVSSRFIVNPSYRCSNPRLNNNIVSLIIISNVSISI